LYNVVLLASINISISLKRPGEAGKRRKYKPYSVKDKPVEVETLSHKFQTGIEAKRAPFSVRLPNQLK